MNTKDIKILDDIINKTKGIDVTNWVFMMNTDTATEIIEGLERTYKGYDILTSRNHQNGMIYFLPTPI